MITSALLPRFFVLALLTGLISCDDRSDQASTIDTTSSTSDRLTATGNDDYLPARDMSGSDLCSILPGDGVANTVDFTFLESSGDPDIPDCEYKLRSDQGRDESIFVSLSGNAGAFAAGRVTAANVDDIPDFGLEAYYHTFPGGSAVIKAVREDGLYFTVNADQRDTAMAVAQLVIDTIP